MLKELKNFSYLWKFSPVIPNGFGEILKWKLHKLLKLICSSFNYWIKFVYTTTASMSPQVRESEFPYPGHFCLWNPKSRKFCLWNPRSWVVESGIQFKESVLPLTIGIQNSSSTDKNWNPVPGIQNPQRGVQNPRLSRLVRVKSVVIKWFFLPHYLGTYFYHFSIISLIASVEYPPKWPK